MRQGWIRDEEVLFDYDIIVHEPLSPGAMNQSIRSTIEEHLGKGESVTVVLLPEYATRDMHMTMPTQAMYALAENGLAHGEGQFVYCICAVTFEPFMALPELEEILAQIPPESTLIDLLTRHGQQDALARFGLEVVDEGDSTWHLACKRKASAELVPTLFAEDVSAVSISMLEGEIADELGGFDATSTLRHLEALSLGMARDEKILSVLEGSPIGQSLRYFGPMRSRCGGARYTRFADGSMAAVLAGSYGCADEKRLRKYHLSEIVPRRSEDIAYEESLGEVLRLAQDLNRLWSETLLKSGHDGAMLRDERLAWGKMGDDKFEGKKQELASIACEHGIDSAIDAYMAGVPIDDILA